MEATRLYESDRLLAVTGAAIRPGGLALTDRAMALCPLPAGARVLDVGCGQGATLACLRERYQLDAVGIDPSSLLIDRARWRARRDLSDPQLAQALVQGRAEQLPFPDLCFSALFFECTLSLMENPLVCLAEAARVLAIGGHVIVTDIYQRSDVPCADASPRTCLAGAVTPAVMRDRLTRSGFVVRCWEDHTDCLQLLAARMVMAYGSLRDAWAQLYPGRSAGDRACDRGRDGSLSRPGYGLLWAQKRSDHG